MVRFEKDFPKPEMLARGMVLGSPLFDDIDPEKVVEAVVTEYRREFASGRLPLQATVISATKPRP